MRQKRKLKRLKSVYDIQTRAREIIPFKGKWKEHIGLPEIRGSWFVCGHSTNGKTSYLLQMTAMLTDFGRVWYIADEEGDSLSFRDAVIRFGVGPNFYLSEDTFDEVLLRLEGRIVPMFLIYDSVQSAGINKERYGQLMEACERRGVQPILVSHAEGKQPSGRPAKYMNYMSFVKIWVEGFKAIVKGSRYGGTEPYVIYKKRADEYWSKMD